MNSILTDIDDINSKKENESNDEDNALSPLKEQLRILALESAFVCHQDILILQFWREFEKCSPLFAQTYLKVNGKWN